jgi:hypothetical protein
MRGYIPPLLQYVLILTQQYQHKFYAPLHIKYCYVRSQKYELPLDIISENLYRQLQG